MPIVIHDNYAVKFHICRRLALAEENTELTKTAKLAQVFKDIFTAVSGCKGQTSLETAQNTDA